jgi:RHS repeat-associated protein
MFVMLWMRTWKSRRRAAGGWSGSSIPKASAPATTARATGCGGWLEGEVWAEGNHLAIYANGQTYFPLTDQVGTERARFSYAGAVVETCMSQPFGDNLQCTGTDSSPYKFGKLERDGESGDDHAQHRDYNSNPYRWLTPDPMGKKVAKLDDPQTWNMYAYVGNNPTTLVDPEGESIGQTCSGSPDICAGVDASMALHPYYGGGELAAAAAEWTAEASEVRVTGTMFGHKIDRVFANFDAWADYDTGAFADAKQQAANAKATESQIDRMKRNAAEDFEPAAANSIDYNNYTIRGGNLDFRCPECNDKGGQIQVGRYGYGVHAPGGKRVGTIHDDTASFVTNNNIRTFSLRKFVRHAWKDVILGNIWYDVIPRGPND